MRISIIGLGKLGAPMAAVMAHKGHSVLGVDLNPQYVDAINQGRAPVDEPGLGQMVARNRALLRATTSYEEAVDATDATFIIVPTPSNSSGAFSLKYVLDAAARIGAALAAKRQYHLVSLCSTVMPGSTAGVLLPALEKASGKRCGADFGLCYNPEFIALGSVIRDMLNPDMILIGEFDKRAGDILESLYRGVCESNPAIARMNFVNAELTKLSVNTYVTTKISYANMLAQVCEKLPGADVDVISWAIGSDSRIGRKYLKGALGYGGPCFPRDNIAFAALARQHGVHAALAEATDSTNRQQVPRLAAMITACLPAGGTAVIAGLSYKPDTNVIDESQGLQLARYLAASGVRVLAYDPAAMENARREVTEPVEFAASLEECVAAADVLAITTPWNEFKSITPAQLARKTGRVTVLDCWRILPRSEFEAACDYITLGLGAAAERQARQPEEVLRAHGD